MSEGQRKVVPDRYTLDQQAVARAAGHLGLGVGQCRFRQDLCSGARASSV